jgi:type I restriction enzyme M protein
MLQRRTEVAATLRAIRARLDLSQVQLAARLGTSYATVNRWEGCRATPQRPARQRIADLAREAGIDPAAVDPAEAAAAVTRRRRRARMKTQQEMERDLYARFLAAMNDFPEFRAMQAGEVSAAARQAVAAALASLRYGDSR